jgi:N-dimethylarginine dimethylaminohydrolase
MMCEPTYFGIQYSINDWMDTKNQAKYDLAQMQWQQLYNKITELGAKIELVQPIKNQPDMTYVDVDLVFDQIFIPSNFRLNQRQGEKKVFIIELN